MIFEYVGNMHMHTPFSDGEAYHYEIAQAAQRAEIDFVIVTDHNIYIDGVQGYYGNDQTGMVLLLTGIEIHDRMRLPQVNHCLVYGVDQRVVNLASNPQALIDATISEGGLAFLAHPFDSKLRWLKDMSAIPWVDWDIHNYTGLEIWNYMSCFKESIQALPQALRNIFQPERGMVGPRTETLQKWDALLQTGQHVVAIGNSDAHGIKFGMGWLQHTIFPYDFLFNCVNTHIFTQTAFSGNWRKDGQQVYEALREGAAFVSYDLLGNARGFRFSAQGDAGTMANMGGTIRLGSGITLQISAPQRGHIKLIRHGLVVLEGENVQNLAHNALETGAYRVEVWVNYLGQQRCWILSNPIYVV